MAALDFGGVGLVLSFAIARWQYDILARLHWLVYGATNLLLVAVIASGVTINGVSAGSAWVAFSSSLQNLPRLV